MILQIELGEFDADDSFNQERGASQSGRRSAQPSVTEAEIETYVRDPAALSDKRRRLISTVISNDDDARRLADFYQTYYRHLEELSDHRPSELDVFIASVYPVPDVVPLFPVEREVFPDSALFELLPGLSTNGSKVLFRPCLLLGAVDANVLLCILRNEDRPDHFRVYVLTSAVEQRSNVLISFTEMELDVFAAAGTADFVAPDDEIDLRLLNSAILRYPVLTFSDRDAKPEPTHLGKDDEEIEAITNYVSVRREGDDAAIEFDIQEQGRANPFRRIAATHIGSDAKIVGLVAEQQTVRIRNVWNRYQLLFYR